MLRHWSQLSLSPICQPTSEDIKQHYLPTLMANDYGMTQCGHSVIYNLSLLFQCCVAAPVSGRFEESYAAVVVALVTVVGLLYLVV